MGIQPTDPKTAANLQSKTKGESHIEHIFKATSYSMAGIGAGLRHEMAFRMECILLVILIPLLVIIPISIVLKSLILFSMFFVLVVEMLNSAIEWVVDYISLEKHPFAKRAKDMGSGAVFFALLNCGLQWTIGILVWLQWIQ